MPDVLSLAGLMVDVTLPIERLPLEAGRHQMARGMFVRAGGTAPLVTMLARLGLQAGILGYVGDDPYGHAARQQLEAEGVDVEYLVTPEGAGSDLTLLLVDGTGRYVFLGVLGTASGGTLPDGWEERLDETRAIVVSGWLYAQSRYPYTFVQAARDARQSGKGVVFIPGAVDADPAWLAALFQTSDVILLDSASADCVGAPDLESAVDTLLGSGARLVAIRLAEGGCVVATPQARVRVPPPATPIAVTVGTAEAFNAAILYGHLAEWPAERIARLAIAAVAATGELRPDGNPLPTRSQVWSLFEPGNGATG